MAENERDFCKNSPSGFGIPEMEVIEVETDGENLQHVGVLRAFTGAILDGTPLVAKGAEGINGLTLSNAMHLSSWLGKPIELPVDEDIYLEELNKKIAGSKVKKETKAAAVEDLSNTYGSK